MSNDDRLAALLEEVTRQQQQGQQPDFEAIGRQHPDLVDELRQLVNVAQMAKQFGPSSATSTLIHPHQPLPPTVALPRSFDGYELMEELGRGAMGVVYKAWDPRLKRFVALKVLLRGEHASAAELARFRSEAQSAAGLSHRNIVPVYQVGDCEGWAYFSMQYVEGSHIGGKSESGSAAATRGRQAHFSHRPGRQPPIKPVFSIAI